MQQKAGFEPHFAHLRPLLESPNSLSLSLSVYLERVRERERKGEAIIVDVGREHQSRLFALVINDSFLPPISKAAQTLNRDTLNNTKTSLNHKCTYALTYIIGPVVHARTPSELAYAS
jgi:hypothetical protein